ncbi:MAG: hypothetical protein IIV17_04990, partial [Clostridia bacterium]|nr:hypothetical protein [Clostridia bacterium]
MTPYELLAQLIARSLAEGVMKKAVFSKPQDKSVRRAVLTPRTLGGKRVAQLEIFFADNKAGHENLSPDDEGRFSAFAMGFGQVNLLTTAGEAELRVSKGGKCTLIGGDRLRRAIEKGGAPLAEVQGNDRKKERILQGDEPFLRLLDVSDATGRVHDKKQSKFRQINRFLELIRDCLSALPKEGELRICDLC